MILDPVIKATIENLCNIAKARANETGDTYVVGLDLQSGEWAYALHSDIESTMGIQLHKMIKPTLH